MTTVVPEVFVFVTIFSPSRISQPYDQGYKIFIHIQADNVPGNKELKSRSKIKLWFCGNIDMNLMLKKL